MLIFSVCCNCCKQEIPEDLSNKRAPQVKTTGQETMVVNHAIGFTFEYHSEFEILHTHNHYQKRKDTTHYILLSKEFNIPEQFQSYQVIHTPVNKAVLMSTTHLGLFDAINQLSAITTLSSTNYFWNETLRQAVAEGKVEEVGRDTNLNLEQVINLQPDLVMAVGYPKIQHQSYILLKEARIPVIYNAEWQELSILGRAEWLKVATILTHKGRQANAFYNQLAATFDSLKMLTQNLSDKTIILSNLPHRGTWFVPGCIPIFCLIMNYFFTKY